MEWIFGLIVGTAVLGGIGWAIFGKKKPLKITDDLRSDYIDEGHTLGLDDALRKCTTRLGPDAPVEGSTFRSCMREHGWRHRQEPL